MPGGRLEPGGSERRARTVVGRGLVTISPEKLAAEAEATGFRADMLEKAARLLAVLDALRASPRTQGEAGSQGWHGPEPVHLRCPETVGRHRSELRGRSESRRHAGRASQDRRSRSRPCLVERTLRFGGCLTEHAGGKWSLHYSSASGQNARLDVDVNFMYRVPLWPVTRHGLALAGKLARHRLFRWWNFTNSRQGSSRRCWRAARRGICSTAD